MFLMDAAAILLCLAALLGLINHHLLKLPFAIGILVSGLLASIAVLVLDGFVPAFDLADTVRAAVLRVDFSEAVLAGMLSLLLFAGALHTDLSLLKEKALPILTLATVGIVISTAAAGGVAWLVFRAVGLDLPLSWCLVFGALISPTDPIAVLGIMKAAGAPPSLEIKVIGESLFNDGVGVVVFAVLLALATSTSGDVGAGDVSLLLAKEVLGGLALGIGAGLIAERGMRTLDEPNLEILITFAVVFGMNFVATRLHLSAPLAAVAAGLLVGNHGRASAMSARTETALDTVWTFIDETLNALLFLLIGVEVFAIDYTRGDYLLAAALLVPAVLGVRLLGVALPLTALRAKLAIGRGTVRLLTWGGIKGGISIALAMKLPDFPGRDAVLTVTYGVVIFSIIVQGLTVGRLISRFRSESAVA
ncbi:MAG: sodium:proton antiporter [Myxococcales bacterium]|nr:sodium:proton antiporter [Myxococcales bacterium]